MLKNMWRMPPWINEADMSVHQRLNWSIGMVPVAPSRSRLLLEGAKKVSGFAGEPVLKGVNISEKM